MDISGEINKEFFKRIEQKVSKDLFNSLKKLLDASNKITKEKIKKIIIEGREIKNEDK